MLSKDPIPNVRNPNYMISHLKTHVCIPDINISNSQDFRLNAETSRYYFES